MNLMELGLDTPVRFIPRVGPALASKLEILGVRTVRDFLYHIPFRYNDFSLVTPIARAQAGETVTIKGTVERFNAFATKSGKRVQEAKVRDKSGTISVIWFNQPFLRSVIKQGMTIHLSGAISWFGNKLSMSSPEYELFTDGETHDSLHTGRIVPVYSATDGVSSKWIRGRMAFLLSQITPSLTDYLPETLRTTHGLLPLTKAINTVHFPTSLEEAEEARRRLAFDELLMLQARAHIQKRKRETEQNTYPFTIASSSIKTFWESLPFTLTADQEQAIGEIFTDLKRTYPMNRLLVGDVGSGKTAVAAAALYQAYKNNTQSVLMAPTQILAQQHFDTLKNLLTPLGITLTLVIGGSAPLSTEQGKEPDVLVGTHALLSEKTKLKKLGLVVIDEQHRFGVTQRTDLIEKGTRRKVPHILTMTATPIPRTVAKTMMGHMDLSTLTTMPAGRQPVKTWVVPKHKRDNAYSWIATQIKQTHGQAFIICPLIEESETLTTVRAVKKEYETLVSLFPHFSLGLLHGRMKPAEKTAVLSAFKEKKHDMLVSTPVVEVGIDIPNATIIVIEAAQRFGLSQLHQLRGRVGRGTLASYCLLFTEDETSQTLSRLKLMEQESSGPKLAEADLALRGAGDILGTRQHGVPNLKIATFSDHTLISQAQQALTSLITDDPQLSAFPLLREEAENSTISESTN
jgi:ATP-dependent DNA helicase RecG